MKIMIIDYDITFTNILLQKISCSGYHTEYTFSLDRIKTFKHKIDYFRLKELIESYKFYINYSFENINVKRKHLNHLTLRMIIHTNNTTFIDKLIMKDCQREDNTFSFISVSSDNWKLKIRNTSHSYLLNISNLHLLKEEVDKLFKLLKNRLFIIFTTKYIKSSDKTIVVNADIQVYDRSYIVSIEKYIQYIIENFQYKVTDTEQAKQLDFSKMTLYNKRNKYQIYQTKKRRIAS